MWIQTFCSDSRQQVFVEDSLSEKQEELDNRESFHKEVSQTQSWLSDTESSLQTMDPEAADVAHSLEKIKVKKTKKQEDVNICSYFYAVWVWKISYRYSK